MSITFTYETNTSYILKNIQWGRISHGSFVDKFLIGKVDEEIVAYAIIGYSASGGIYLNGGDMTFPEIDYVLEWVQVKPNHRGKGYGKAIVSYIRDEYMSKRIPIALYAEDRTETTHPFYYKLGAIHSCAQHTCADYLVFLHKDQIQKYMPEDYEETIKFEEKHALRRVCGVKHVSSEIIASCDWLPKDNDPKECEGCSVNWGKGICDEICPCLRV